MESRLTRVKNFVKGEEGYTAQALIWTGVVGLGSAAVAFGLLSAERFQGGNAMADMKAITTPQTIPVPQEQITTFKAGYTGAITNISVGAATTTSGS